jgi:hypothetical protein
MQRSKVPVHIYGSHNNANKIIRICNNFSKNVVMFKHLGTTMANPNHIHDEIKSRLNSGNACYYSVKNI